MTWLALGQEIAEMFALCEGVPDLARERFHGFGRFQRPEACTARPASKVRVRRFREALGSRQSPERRRAIFALIAQGLSRRAVARRLGVCRATVARALGAPYVRRQDELRERNRARVRA